MAGVLVADLLIAGTGWWATHPDRFDGPGGSSVGIPTAVNTPVLVGLFAYPRSGEVRTTSVTPRIRENTAAARIRVLFCVGGSGIGAVRSSAEELCTHLLPAGGRRLSRARRADGQLVLEITPTRTGRVQVDGVDVSYRAGIRRGKEATGVAADVTTT